MQPEIYRQLRHCLDTERLVAVATIVAGQGRGRQLLLAPGSAEAAALRQGDLGSPELEAAVDERARELLQSFQSQRFALSPKDGGEFDLFIEVHPPRPKLIIVGAVHVAVALITLAKTLGFKTIVVDPRTAFATPERFAHADQLVTDWPDEALPALGINENTYLALLSHDLKLDVPALAVALPSPARYIGALGSKKTHRKRLAALAEAGIEGPATERIHNPIGLDLGGRRAEEIALAVLAEMVAVRHGKSRP
ncbi:MAG: XdhC/CoxI family protein [Acidobacteriota bacterium]